MYYTKNLTKQSVTNGWPWEQEVDLVPEKVRTDKAARQEWYMDPNTVHCFYTGYEGLNPNQRVGPTNPVQYVHAFVADIDHSYSREVLMKKVEKLPIKPTYIEQSLGGKWHLVWVLSEATQFPQDTEITELLMTSLSKTFGIEGWKGFDEPSWSTASRMYCMGTNTWEKVGEEISPDLVKSTVMDMVIQQGKATKACPVPLERIYELLKAKYPSMEWPGEFELQSTGPSFWIEGSTSPKSAIVHADGIYTFSAHRSKDKYYWDDLLGKGTLARDREERIRRATKNVYFDGLAYYGPREDNPGYMLIKPESIRRTLSVQYALSSKIPKGEDTSELEKAMYLIEHENQVDGAAPFIFRRPGKFQFNGGSYLNMIDRRPAQPALGPALWGPEGGFPFISGWLEQMFPKEALPHFISWLHRFYSYAIRGETCSGHTIFLAGPPGVGKTLLSHHLIGKLMGGVGDATRYLLSKDLYGGNLYESPVWCVDDTGMTNRQFTIRQFTSNIKRISANRVHEFHQKFQKASLVLWEGRLIVTCNLDFQSLKVIPVLQDGLGDKVCLYRLNQLPEDFHPADVEQILENERAYFAKFILDWKVPEEYGGAARYGIKPYHDPLLLEASMNNSGLTRFFEAMVMFMRQYTKCMRTDHIKGTAIEIHGEMNTDERLRAYMRGVSVDDLTHLLSSLREYKPDMVDHEFNDLRVWTINWKGKNE